MLNERLFKALEASFGEVLIENEDEPADIERTYDYGLEAGWRFPDGGQHGEQYRINCPFCKGADGNPDRKHHMYISYLAYARPEKDGVQLAQGPLIAHCFRRGCEVDQRNRKALEDAIYAGFAYVDNGTEPTTVSLTSDGVVDNDNGLQHSVSLESIRTWVPEFRWCADGMTPEIADYLASRGIDDATAVDFNLGWGRVQTPRSHRMLNHGAPFVVIPVIMNGELKGVQARCPDSRIEGEGLRYWIHPGMRKRSVVYNLDNARTLGTGVLCEGVFDVFKVGLPGVCCFGHLLSITQKNLLSTIQDCLILLPDTDPHEDFDTVQEARALAAEYDATETFKLGAHVVVLPAKDPGSMSRQEVWTQIAQQVPSDVLAHLEERIMPYI